MVSKKGDYLVEGVIPKDKEPVVVKKERRPLKTYNPADISAVVERLPIFPGGNDKFQAFIDKLEQRHGAFPVARSGENLCHGGVCY